MQVDQTKKTNKHANKQTKNKTKQKQKQNKNRTKNKTEQFVLRGDIQSHGLLVSKFTPVFQPRSWHKTTSEAQKGTEDHISWDSPYIIVHKLWRCWYMQAFSQLTLCRVIKVIQWSAYLVQGFQSLLSLQSKILSYHIKCNISFSVQAFFFLPGKIQKLFSGATIFYNKNILVGWAILIARF